MRILAGVVDAGPLPARLEGLNSAVICAGAAGVRLTCANLRGRFFTDRWKGPKVGARAGSS